MTEPDTPNHPGWEALVSLLGLVILGYVGGAYSAVFNVFPYPQLLKSRFSALASTDEQGVAVPGTPTSPSPWQSTWFRSFGPIRHSPAPQPDDAILYASGHRPEAVLIDRSGDLLHRWRLPFDQVWTSPPHLTAPVDRQSIFWRRIHLFDNGDLLALYTSTQTSPQGYGLVKIDRQSNLRWAYANRTHHDFALGGDGTIFALTQTTRNTSEHPVSGLPQLPDQIMADSVVHLTPDGRERRRLSLLEVLATSPYRGALQMVPTTIETPGETRWDPLHTNSVSVVDSEFATHHSFAEPGQLLLSFRALDLLALLDLDRQQIVWATRGAWWQPTDADPLSDGDILVYDSNGHGANGLASRVLKFDPTTEKVAWSYSGTERQPFWSRDGGTQQPLPGGGVLITSPLTGQIKDVGPDGDLQWEFRNPHHRERAGQTEISTLWDAQRLSPREVTELGFR